MVSDNPGNSAERKSRSGAFVVHSAAPSVSGLAATDIARRQSTFESKSQRVSLHRPANRTTLPIPRSRWLDIDELFVKLKYTSLLLW